MSINLEIYLCKLPLRNTESSPKSLKIFHEDIPEIKHGFSV